ncbi:MAG: HD domain-containing protein, partial [Myxococcota bacterium]
LQKAHEAELRRLGRNLNTLGGLAVVGSLSAWLDGHLKEVQQLLAPFADPCPVAVYATGSYGRQQVCPGSDIDLLVLYDEAHISTCDLGLWVGGFQTMLRDIGWKVGMATRTSEQCLALAREDLSIAASMLDARLLWHDPQMNTLPWEPERLSQTIADQLREGDGGRSFVRQVREGSRLRHEKSGRTVYRLEPNIKHGRGGLRDLQALQWSALVLFSASSIGELARMPGFEIVDFEALRDAADFLFRTRVALHLEGGQFANDRLTFRNQEALAVRLGYSSEESDRALLAVERFMQDFYRAAHTLASMSLRWQDIWLLPEVDSRPVAVAPGLCIRQCHIDLVRLKDQLDHNELLPTPIDEPRTEETPSGGTWPALRPGLVTVLHPTSEGLIRSNPLQIYEAALDTGFPLHPMAEAHLAREAQRVNTQRVEGPRMALSLRRLLCSLDCPEELIQSLADLRLLAAVLPEFQAVTALAQHNVYHVYTVDAHLLRAMHEAKNVLSGRIDALPAHAEPFVEIAAQIPSHRHEVLMLACLLHDIGKGRGKGHAQIGARFMHDIGARLFLTRHQIDQLAFLVREHLLLPLVS